jgi:hypothetical protein
MSRSVLRKETACCHEGPNRGDSVELCSGLLFSVPLCSNLLGAVNQEDAKDC